MPVCKYTLKMGNDMVNRLEFHTVKKTWRIRR